MRGAREHNLKNVSVDIPRDQLVVITGLSGSGKSSLAFDTIYAEGQRRYVESLSAYARQFLELMSKPDVDLIEGLSPAISIEQKTTSRNPRSTVGTVTEIADYMRLLWARVGVPYSPATGLPIESQTVSQMVDKLAALPDGERLYLLAPVVRDRKGEYRKEIAEWRKAGFQRLKIDGAYYPIEDAPALDKQFKHDIDVVVDRLVTPRRPGEPLRRQPGDGAAPRRRHRGGGVGRHAEGRGRAAAADLLGEVRLSGQRLHHRRDRAAPVLVQRARRRLSGVRRPGHEAEVQRGPGRARPRQEPAQGRGGAVGARALAALHPDAAVARRHYQFSMDQPWSKLPEIAKGVILHGSAGEKIKFTYDDNARKYEVTKPFEGVLPNLERRWRETDSSWVREELGRYQAETPCEACGGARLKPEALSVKIAGKQHRRDLDPGDPAGARLVRRPGGAA